MMPHQKTQQFRHPDTSDTSSNTLCIRGRARAWRTYEGSVRSVRTVSTLPFVGCQPPNIPVRLVKIWRALARSAVTFTKGRKTGCAIAASYSPRSARRLFAVPSSDQRVGRGAVASKFPSAGPATPSAVFLRRRWGPVPKIVLCVTGQDRRTSPSRPKESVT